MTPAPTIFAPLFVAATALFIISCWRRLSLTALGKPDNRLNDIGQRIGDTLRYGFAQLRGIRKPYGIVHLVIFWCFLVLMIANAEFILHGLFPGISFSKLPDGLFVPLIQMIDLVSLITLVAVLIAMIRRAVAPPYPEARTFEAFFILSLVALLMLANFGINAAKLSRLQGPVRELAIGIMPVSSLFLPLVQPAQAKLLHDLSWWLHAGALLLFMNLLPYSKHFHIITALSNIFLRRQEQPVIPPREEFVKGNRFGINQIDGYSWKELLDSFSCTECGRCQLACPASATGKPLNPRRLIHDLKLNLLKNGVLLKRGSSRNNR